MMPRGSCEDDECVYVIVSRRRGMPSEELYTYIFRSESNLDSDCNQRAITYRFKTEINQYERSQRGSIKHRADIIRQKPKPIKFKTDEATYAARQD